MAEAAAALGLVASIIQLADFAERLLRRLDEFKDDLKTLPGAFQAIKVRLPVVVDSIHHIQTQAATNTVSSCTSKLLLPLLTACLDEVTYLDHVINKALPPKTAKTLERYYRAWRSLGKDKSVEKHLLRLDGHLQALVLHQLNTTLACSSSTKNFHQKSRSTDWSSTVSTAKDPRDQTTEQYSVALPTKATAENDEAAPTKVWQGRILSKPSLFDDIATEIRIIERETIVSDDTEKDATLVTELAEILKVCSCKPQYISHTLRCILNNFSLFSHIICAHRRDCPLFRPNNVTRRFGFEASYIGKWLNKVVKTALVVDFGAGGLSISPTLQLRGFRKSESPAFTIFDEFDWPEVPTINQRISILSQISTRLLLLYEARDASPTEVNERGDTFADIAENYIHTYPGDLTAQDSRYIAVKNMFFQNLVSLGVPMNEKDRFGNTMLTKLVTHNCYHEQNASLSFLQRLAENGAEFEETDWDKTWSSKFSNSLYDDDYEDAGHLSCLPKLMVEAMQVVVEFAEALQCNNLSLAILSKSALYFEKIMHRCPQAIHQKNLVGQTALHLAVIWPWALEKLLTAGACVSECDNSGILPLSYACCLGEEDSVRILLAAKSPLSSQLRHYSVLDDASAMENLPIFSLIVDALVERRALLLELARQNLPPQKLKNIATTAGVLPEWQDTAFLLQELLASGVELHFDYFCHNTRSIYLTKKLTATKAEYLHSSGFKNVDTLDILRNSPLMSTMEAEESQIRLVPWLVSKGAAIHRQEFGCLHCVPMTVHFVCAGLGYYIAIKSSQSWKDLDSDAEFRVLLTHVASAFRAVFSPELLFCTDGCECHCSLFGCTPFTMVLKAFMRGPFQKCCSYSGESRWYSERLWSISIMEVVMYMLRNIKVDLSISPHLVEAAIRIIKFEELGLTHTCCRLSNTILHPIELVDAQEIRDEERTTIQELESYVSIRKPDLPIRKASAAKPEQLVDEEYYRSLRELGVKIYENGDKPRET